MVDRTPVQLPVTAHLPRAFDLGGQNALSGMSRAMERVAHLLTWEYGYKRVPKTLARKYAYCEVLGPQGPVKSDRMILGFVLFAPNTTYPQHSHSDIEESYVSIAGAWSENELAVYAPGSLILNKPGEEHRITTGQYDPWRRILPLTVACCSLWIAFCAAPRTALRNPSGTMAMRSRVGSPVVSSRNSPEVPYT